tara:strand:+ start:3060 stop:3842 length:783 start_codon:yes stop_codon:yes gene_type:complete
VSVELPEFSNGGWCSQLSTEYLSTMNWNALIDVGPGVVNSEAWVFKDYFDRLTVFGFEPSVVRYDNIKDSYPGELYPHAVSSHTGILHGLMGNDDEQQSQFYSLPRDGEEQLMNDTVTCVTVDNICSQLPENLKALLWLDAEGAEFDIIRGAVKSILAGKIIGMNVEINFSNNFLGKSRWPRWEETFIFLQHLGFVALGCSDSNATTSYFPGEESKPEEFRQQYLSTYNLSAPTNDQADVFFIYDPLSAWKLPAKYFKVT